MPRYIPALLFVSLLLLLAYPSQAQSGSFRVDHIVKVASIEEHLFHVTTEVKNINQPSLDLSLPTWTPGWYTIENYAKNILRFSIADASGARLPHTLTHKQTWRVDTRGLKQLRIDFDYRADVLALNQAKIANDFAFFTGTELFLMAEGHRNAPSNVRFDMPPGWKIVSSLNETADPAVFSAPEYDTLVDSTTEMGRFDVTKFEVDGKQHFFVSTPAGVFSKNKAESFSQMLAAIARAESAVFRVLPYDKYVYLYFFARPESNAGGALEHANSHVAFAGLGDAVQPRELAGLAAHEFFHLWNVKRIRPVEMWPYDYSREDETPLLWVSEGFTNYYAGVALYRAKLQSKDSFLREVAEAIAGVETNPARSYISPADSSISTWLGYDTPTAFGISYYTQGQNLGAILDLSIRNDTAGSASLDDVMRALYSEHYGKGRGFSTEDMIGIINRLTSRDYHEFYRRYVSGVDKPDYDKILGYAGFKLERVTTRIPVFGFDWNQTQDGIEVVRVEPGEPAASAGLAPGDFLISIDGQDVQRSLRSIRERGAQTVGQTVVVGVKRGGISKTLNMKVGSRDEETYNLVEIPQATQAQLKLRAGWLKD